MTPLDTSLTPRPIDGADPQSVDATPTAEEFFILSRLDGSMTIAQICQTSGLGKAKTLEAIANLRDYGLIELPGAEEGQASDAESTAPEDAPSTAPDSTPDDLGQQIIARFDVDFEQASLDGDILSQQTELDSAFQREVLFIHTHMDDLNHYQLLGVPRDAARRQLRRAYFPMSKRYHPDRFYQQILGDYESLIRDIFERVTDAYQTLSHRGKRATYDKSLEANPATSTTSSTQATPRGDTSSPHNKKKTAQQALLQRARKALSQGQSDEAVRAFKKALGIAPSLDLALSIGEELLEQHLLDHATSFVRAGRRIDDTSALPLIHMANIYEAKDAPEDALYYLEEAQKLGAPDLDLNPRIERIKSVLSN